jgi:hypothetical protein
VLKNGNSLATDPPIPRNDRIFEMINECTSNLLKHLEKTFSKASNCLKTKYRKQNARKKVLTFFYFFILDVGQF